MRLKLISPRSMATSLTSISAPQDLNSPILRLSRLNEPTILAERDPLKPIYHAIIPSMEANEEITWEVTSIDKVDSICDISYEKLEDQVNVSMGGTPFMNFHHDPSYPKPFINPILTPDGINMLRDPLPPYSDEEHPWHRGLTLMQGAINGVDCWGEFERPGFGRTTQNNMTINQGPLSLSINTHNTWFEKDRPLMSDHRYYRLFNTNRNTVVLDILFTIITDHGPVTIGPTKEGGFLTIRVNPSMNASGDGHMENTYGADDEEGCWSKRAHWMDYSGPVGDNIAGFSVFDHPDNPRYPTAWHVRDYGLFAANCWMIWDDFYCPENTETNFRWRIIIHTGSAQEAGISDHFLNYLGGSYLLGHCYFV